MSMNHMVREREREPEEYHYDPVDKHIFFSRGMQARSLLKFTCSKSTIETLEEGVKYIQS